MNIKITHKIVTKLDKITHLIQFGISFLCMK
jgi:hypothetical protein